MRKLSSRSSIIILWLICIVATIPQYYLLTSILEILGAINDGVKSIPFDTGSSLYLLLNLFWVLLLIESIGQTEFFRKHKKLCSPALILFFLVNIIVCIGLSYWVDNRLKSSGYVPCKDEREISRVSPGHSYIYQTDECLL